MHNKSLKKGKNREVWNSIDVDNGILDLSSAIYPLFYLSSAIYPLFYKEYGWSYPVKNTIWYYSYVAL